MFSLEHIDPQKSKHICGLRNEFNEVLADLTYNKRKSNRFVPYRICEHPAPVWFGNVGEFLINDEWIVCEFGGETWWKESNRIGNSQIDWAKLPASEKQKAKARENCRKLGARVGSTNVKRATAAATVANQRKVRLTRIEDGATFEFSSQKEACKNLNLNPAHVSSLVNGGLTHHKGFTAMRIT